MTAKKKIQTATLVVFGLVTLAQVWAVLAITGGQLIYTLDDPYIHLSVSEMILQGEYGVNPGENASPSSSMLYPFLLCVPMLLGFADWGPLVIGVLAMGAALWILSGMIHSWAFAGEHRGTAAHRVAALTVPLLILAVNGYALPMTGMEHSIHVLAVVLILVGLIAMADQDSPPLFLILGIVLCALIRFEGMALALAALGAVYWQGHRRAALITFAILAGTVALYLGAMTRLGLPLLPSSVLVKSSVSAAVADGRLLDVAKKIAANIYGALTNRWGILFAVTVALLCVSLARRRGANRRAHLLVAATSIFALASHIALGKYGWFGRYEVYATTIMLIAVTFLYSDTLRQLTGWRLAVLPLMLAVVGAPYYNIAMSTPAAAANIYQQQYQMHRFVDEYLSRDVAVNDLGWVAYRNDHYVLDLWGLGSEEARKMNSSASGRTAIMIDALARSHAVSYAMIYDSWFPKAVPDRWCRMAVLKTSWVTSGSDTVSFYLIDTNERATMALALLDFEPTLPKGSSLKIYDCNSG